jgi:hypothetical protein
VPSLWQTVSTVLEETKKGVETTKNYGKEICGFVTTIGWQDSSHVWFDLLPVA